MMWGCMVGRLSTGEYLMSGPIGGGEILVYGNDGGPAIRSIGRSGRGPGEFGERVRLLVGPGDTVHVLDDSNRRLVSLDPSGGVVESFQVLYVAGAFALLRNGSLVIHRKPTGLPGEDSTLFYVLDPSGNELARFGEATRQLIGDDQWIVSAARPSGFWTASMWQYELYRHSTPGVVEQTLSRNVEWFPRDGELSPDIYEAIPPPPNLAHIWQDSAGRLWTYSVVPDTEWEPGLRQQSMPDWTRRTFDTMIEVIDLERARLIAQERYDHWLGAVCGDRLMYTVVETSWGDTRVSVLEPNLVGLGKT